LAALTAIHNFHLRRPDGRTAAERFFGRAHPPLFEQVLARSVTADIAPTTTTPASSVGADAPGRMRWWSEL
jgi:hypothetical protein